MDTVDADEITTHNQPEIVIEASPVKNIKVFERDEKFGNENY